MLEWIGLGLQIVWFVFRLFLQWPIMIGAALWSIRYGTLYPDDEGDTLDQLIAMFCMLALIVWWIYLVVVLIDTLVHLL